MADFSSWIEDMELHDPHLNGGTFTWYRGAGHDSAARLDRFLYSIEWEVQFRNIRQQIMPRVISDHNPVMLQCGDWEQRKAYFKFENWWLNVEGFKDLVQNWWNGFVVDGCPDFKFSMKLKMLKQKLKDWSSVTFGELNNKKNSLLSELAEMDLIQNDRALTEDEMMIRATVLVELEELAKNEESRWRQKSRVLWLKQGDNNTKFFQRVATTHRRCNTIDRLIINGEENKDPKEIKDHITEFYKQLYTESESWRPSFVMTNCPRISQEEQEWMQRPFSKEEVVHILKLCDGDKAPGPDGFTMLFFKKCWGIITSDAMQTIHNFHQNEVFERSLNATFVVLIPKKLGAVELKDFKPISLIGGMYKIIAKLITERMKTVMGRLIDEHQMAFLKDRQIMDASLLANELVDSREKQKIPGILCKLDIEKAYDHVNWNYLWKVLSEMGFGRKWVNWIKFCVSIVKFSIITNGSPEGFFQSQRGLRQGDPMSPFLFLLAMEGLNYMVRKANEMGWIRGFGAHTNRANNMEVTHLLYADDSLVFCGAEVSQIRHLRAILTIFEGISGLHVNWQKSCLFPVNQVNDMQGLADNLGCQVASLPTKYLGMPLGAKNKKLEVWSEVLERSERKLTRWKSQYISLGGRLTLIKSVLDALPTYMLSLFPLPKSIGKKLNKLRRVFLWQGNKEKQGYNQVKWEEVTMSKAQGGLGIKKLSTQNTNLLQKWL
ncbi:hypothetical protein MTR67_053159 [Solanum verrucosum]|uniref:Reverse transcriptase domain-containing protein n=1 Tax=Solanum verrucosum TaxID=315347 RepID=A0AAF0V9N1_SOLVR|nr:hypothetical protein MTR67_053159 [Solanum verrucosum]